MIYRIKMAAIKILQFFTFACIFLLWLGGITHLYAWCPPHLLCWCNIWTLPYLLLSQLYYSYCWEKKDTEAYKLCSTGVESNHTKYGDKLLQYCCDVHFAKQHTIYMMQANLLWIFLAQNMMHHQQYDFSFLENFGTCNRRCCWLQLDIQMATPIADHYFFFPH